MKIAFISVMEGAAWGGSEELWSKTAAYALQMGHSVLISIIGRESLHPRVMELQKAGAIIYCRTQPYFAPDPKPNPVPRPKPSLLKRAIRRSKRVFVSARPVSTPVSIPPQLINSSIEVIQKFEPDVICVSQGGCYDLAYMPLKGYLCESNVPFSIICHSYDEINIPNDSRRAEVIELFSKASKVFMIAKHQMATVERQLARRFNNFLQIRNPINIQNPEIIDFPSLETIHFANVASLDIVWKGQDLLLEVLGQQKWKDRNWELHFYGMGSDINFLQSLASFYNISERVHFHGYVNDLKKVWINNHLLVNPSRIDSGPMTILEAMLCGRPVVATAVGLSLEQIIDGKTGFIAEAATMPLLDKALERAWFQKNEWEIMGKMSYKSMQSISKSRSEELLLNILLENFR